MLTATPTFEPDFALMRGSEAFHSTPYSRTLLPETIASEAFDWATLEGLEVGFASEQLGGTAI